MPPMSLSAWLWLSVCDCDCCCGGGACEGAFGEIQRMVFRSAAHGDEVAWDTVRLKLQELIDNENKQQPLSDEELVKELAAGGISRPASESPP